MFISIGILAYNESNSIAKILRSLFQQSIFTDAFLALHPDTAIEVVIVPNGCTDATAEIAEETLQQLIQGFATANVRYQICNLEQPGKSNAWNFYVHQFSDPAADYLILMDADIQFVRDGDDTLQQLVSTLESVPEASIAVDTPIKDVALKQKKTPMEWLSVKLSKQSADSATDPIPAICGQLYCGRASALRKIWMPVGLPVEDGYLRAVVATAGFTQSNALSNCIVHAKSAAHVFEAYIGIGSLLNHEKRLIIGSVINAFLFGYLWANCHPQQLAGDLIKLENEQDPHWLEKRIRQEISQNGWWIIPNAFTFRRIESLQRMPLHKKISSFPIATLAFFADLYVCWQANQALRTGVGLGYWGKRQREVV